ncbi:stress enhanced protein 2, chloroplastic [Neltuma alba]|uniref:stress enhanced protein 2, chloroplastic n=1 Tax=Neltuma alba TaxID=207710 RepID=UPI0010A2B6D1|nr:stress enhanced protein 2, chloroplastic [Prosopis alba]
MASATRAPLCRLRSPRSAVRSRGSQSGPVKVSVPEPKTTPESESTNIVLQPRLSNLRAYGSDPVGVIKTRNDGNDGADDVSPFFATLSDYIESYKKSQDFETISGRLAMMVFAVTVTKELMTGSSVFGKMDIEGLTEAGGVCLGAVACAALFAWFSSARTRVGRIFSVGCNSFIDAVIDQIVDGLFYESDWPDEL